jgi:hypothetical protein
MVELEAAVRCGANVILVRKSGARWADAAGNYECEHPPESLIMEQEPCTRDTLRSSRAIKHSDEYYTVFGDRLVAQLEAPEVAAAEQPRRAAAVLKDFGDASEPCTPATRPLSTRRLSMSLAGAQHHRPSRSVSVLPFFADGGDAAIAAAGDAAGATSAAPAAEAAAAQQQQQQQQQQQSMREELTHLQLAVQSLRHELAEGARAAQALQRAGDAPVARALALLPAWISAVGTLCCVVLAAVALQALRVGVPGGGRAE